MKAPTISEVKNHGRPRICVTIHASLTRKRRRVFFPSMAAAEDFRRRAMDEAKDTGFRWALMSPSRRDKLAQLAAWLEEQGIDPMDVPRFLAKRPVIRAGMTLGKAAEEFLAAKAAKGCREKYLVKLRRSVGLFLANRREVPVSDVESGDLEEFLGRNGYAPGSNRAHLAAVVRLARSGPRGRRSPATGELGSGLAARTAPRRNLRAVPTQRAPPFVRVLPLRQASERERDSRDHGAFRSDALPSLPGSRDGGRGRSMSCSTCFECASWRPKRRRRHRWSQRIRDPPSPAGCRSRNRWPPGHRQPLESFRSKLHLTGIR